MTASPTPKGIPTIAEKLCAQATQNVRRWEALANLYEVMDKIDLEVRRYTTA